MRKELLRDVIDHLQSSGVTVFFSSHLLYEVEPVSDIVAILDHEHIIKQATTEQLRQEVKQLMMSKQQYDSLGPLPTTLDIKCRDNRVAVIARNWDQYYLLAKQWVIPLEYLHFVGMMLMVSIAMAVMSWFALKHNWHLQINKKSLVWSLGVVIVLLFASCAFQLGSNLTAEEIVPLGPEGTAEGRAVARIASEQNRGVLLLYNSRPNWIQSDVNFSVCALDLLVSNTHEVKEILTHTGYWPGYAAPNSNQLILSPQHANRVYLLPNEKLPEPTGVMQSKNDELWTIALDAPVEKAIIHRLDLKKHLPDLRTNSRNPNIHLFGNTIYVYGGKKLLLIDISDPDTPKVARSIPVERFGFSVDHEGPNSAQVCLKHLRIPVIPGLTDQERFGVSLHLATHDWAMAYDDNVLVVATREHISTYRIQDLAAECVNFTLIGRRMVNPLKRFAGFSPKQIIIQNGLAYVLDTEHSFGGLTVFDIRNAKRPRRIGHYGAPEEQFFAMTVLPNNRILVGGQNLHIVVPPRLQQ